MGSLVDLIFSDRVDEPRCQALENSFSDLLLDWLDPIRTFGINRRSSSLKSSAGRTFSLDCMLSGSLRANVCSLRRDLALLKFIFKALLKNLDQQTLLCPLHSVAFKPCFFSTNERLLRSPQTPASDCPLHHLTTPRRFTERFGQLCDKEAQFARVRTARVSTFVPTMIR
jgi:hypothetical protein